MPTNEINSYRARPFEKSAKNHLIQCRWRVVIITVLTLVAPLAAYAGNCKLRQPPPAIVLSTMGPCSFDQKLFAFSGNSIQQAECLLRPVARWGKIGPTLPDLPLVLADRVGRAFSLPENSALEALLAELSLDRRLGGGLFEPISRARDNDQAAPPARYLVIHDTSGPKLGSFPPDVNENRAINNLARFHCSDSNEIAHAIINRRGEIFMGHDFSVPWRATKFERALNFHGDLKGLFLHVELIQPRTGGRYDVVAPNPGFTTVQYDRLALIYTIASMRAGQWLIPAFHAVIDYDITGGHDDPQNFELGAFARSLETLFDQLQRDASLA
jgi:hypothetical protein